MLWRFIKNKNNADQKDSHYRKIELVIGTVK